MTYNKQKTKLVIFGNMLLSGGAYLWRNVLEVVRQLWPIHPEMARRQKMILLINYCQKNLINKSF